MRQLTCLGLHLALFAQLAGFGCSRQTGRPSSQQSQSDPPAAGAPSQRLAAPEANTATAARGESPAPADTATGWTEAAQLTGHHSGIKSLGFLAHGATLISADFDGVLKVWDLRSQTEVRSLAAHPGGRFGRFAVSPQADCVITAGFDGQIRLWDPATWQTLGTLPGRRPIYCLSISADGTKLATAGKRLIEVWDLNTHDKLTTVNAGFWPITGLAFALDGSTLFACGIDCFENAISPSAGGLICAYNLADAQLRAKIKFAYPVMDLRMSSDNALLAAGADGCQAMRWVDHGNDPQLEQLSSFQEPNHLKSHVLPEQLAAIDVNERLGLIAAAAEPAGPKSANAGHVRIFDYHTGKSLGLLIPERGSRRASGPYKFGLKAVAVSSDGRWIAAGGSGGAITLWERGPNGEPLEQEIPAEPSDLAQFGAEGGHDLALASGDGSFDERRLALLEATFRGRRGEFFQLAQALQNPKERSMLYRDLYPRHQPLMERLLDLAANTREPATKLDALAFAVYLFAKSNSEDLEAEYAQVVDLLVDDCLTQAELARIFYLLENKPNRASERLFERAIRDSPVAEVRGHALYSYGNYLCRKAAMARWVKTGELGERYDDAGAILLRDLRDHFIAAFPAADPEQLEAEAACRYEQTIREFPTVIKRPETYNRLPDPQNPNIRGWKPVPLGELARRAIAALRQLTEGREAPEIAGQDAHGNTFKLSDYRGKVVLLCFSGDWCGSCVARYPHYRELLERFKDRPFAVVQVSSDTTRESLVRSMAEGKITWPCWWDGPPPGGPISAAWQVEAWPTLYLLDRDGVIRRRNVFGSALEESIESLLGESQSP